MPAHDIALPNPGNRRIKASVIGRGALTRPRPHNCRADGLLVVKLQEVVPGQTESADRGLFTEASMRSVPVVAMQP